MRSNEQLSSFHRRFVCTSLVSKSDGFGQMNSAHNLPSSVSPMIDAPWLTLHVGGVRNMTWPGFFVPAGVREKALCSPWL
jgi:hypothetical protein